MKNLAALFVGLTLMLGCAQETDPLPSWNEGASKSAILDFVRRVTDPANHDFVPAPERIATFDNDGTLWTEQPMYVQLLFVIDRVRELAPGHPQWKTSQPFQAVLESQPNDAPALAAALATGGKQGLFELLFASHTGMTTDEFERIVTAWIATAEHPRFKRPFTDLVFQPMLELMAYLRANDFKVFIVSGGGIEFMRPWTERVYGVPPEQVVGSSVKTEFQLKDGEPVLVRIPKINFIDDKAGKPVGIHEHIGRRPILAFGNADADIQMIQWTKAGEGLRLGLFLRHTDAEREYAYDRKGHIGTLDAALDMAAAEGWIIVSMKDDWKRVYAWESAPE